MGTWESNILLSSLFQLHNTYHFNCSIFTNTHFHYLHKLQNTGNLIANYIILKLQISTLQIVLVNKVVSSPHPLQRGEWQRYNWPWQGFQPLCIKWHLGRDYIVRKSRQTRCVMAKHPPSPLGLGLKLHVGGAKVTCGRGEVFCMHAFTVALHWISVDWLSCWESGLATPPSQSGPFK